MVRAMNPRRHVAEGDAERWQTIIDEVAEQHKGTARIRSMIVFAGRTRSFRPAPEARMRRTDYAREVDEMTTIWRVSANPLSMRSRCYHTISKPWKLMPRSRQVGDSQRSLSQNESSDNDEVDDKRDCETAAPVDRCWLRCGPPLASRPQPRSPRWRADLDQQGHLVDQRRECRSHELRQDDMLKAKIAPHPESPCGIELVLGKREQSSPPDFAIVGHRTERKGGTPPRPPSEARSPKPAGQNRPAASASRMASREAGSTRTATNPSRPGTFAHRTSASISPSGLPRTIAIAEIAIVLPAPASSAR